MALRPALKKAVERIARALKDYASQKGWGPDDYRIYILANEEWGRIKITFVGKDFGTLDNYGKWAEVHDFLDRELAGEPGIGYTIGLSVRDSRQVEEGGIYAIGPAYTEISDYLVSGPVSST
jgi:hypothetical protein